MQTNHFLLVKKLKNTDSAQLWLLYTTAIQIDIRHSASLKHQSAKLAACAE